MNAEASTSKQMMALKQIPKSLRTFLAGRLGEDEITGCVTESITLRAVHGDGYAFGSEDSTCGDGQSLWGVDDGQWEYLVQFSDPPSCRSLYDLELPTNVPGLRCIADGKATDY